MKLPTVPTPFSILLIILLYFKVMVVSGINIRSNLDFDDDHHKPGIIDIQRDYIRPPTKTEKTDNPETRISVNCGPGGCNTTTPTKTKPPASDTFATDVVVQVQVNANDEKHTSRTNPATGEAKSITAGDNKDDDVADVPVVVGYAGGGTPPARIIPPANNAPNFDNNYHTDHVKTGGGFVPSAWGVNVELKPRGHYPDDYTRYHGAAAAAAAAPQPRPQANLWRGNNYNVGGVVRQPNWHQYANPTPWYYNRRSDYRPTQSPPPATTCVCHPNSVWSSPTTQTPYVNFNHPGKQINGKLAPLY